MADEERDRLQAVHEHRQPWYPLGTLPERTSIPCQAQKNCR